MVCIYCGDLTGVTNSRLQKRSNNIWRRRVCNKCGAIFTTNEKANLAASFVVAKEGSTKLEPFLREKLFLSVYSSCQHRPSALSEAIELTETIIAELPFSNRQPISAADIAQITHKILRRFDSVAGTFYKAYHLKEDKATS